VPSPLLYFSQGQQSSPFTYIHFSQCLLTVRWNDPLPKSHFFSTVFHCRVILWLWRRCSGTIFFYMKNWVGIVLGTGEDSMLLKWIWGNYDPWLSRELRNVPNFTLFVLWFLLPMMSYLLGMFLSMVFLLSSIHFLSWLASKFWFLITPIFCLICIKYYISVFIHEIFLLNLVFILYSNSDVCVLTSYGVVLNYELWLWSRLCCEHLYCVKMRAIRSKLLLLCCWVWDWCSKSFIWDLCCALGSFLLHWH
jgi:hypothetical protein